MKVTVLVLIFALMASAVSATPIASQELCRELLSFNADVPEFRGSFNDYLEKKYAILMDRKKALAGLPRKGETEVTIYKEYRELFKNNFVEHYEYLASIYLPPWVNDLNAYLAGVDWGVHSTPEKVSAIYSATPSEKLLISVHSQGRLATSAWHVLMSPKSGIHHRIGFADRVYQDILRSEEFADVPRLLLTSETFPIPKEEFLREATVVQQSHSGELPIAPLAFEYHLVGEQFSNCVSQTVRYLLQAAKKQPLNFAPRFIFHEKYLLDAYSDEFTGENFKLWRVDEKVAEVNDDLKMLSIRANVVLQRFYQQQIDIKAESFDAEKRCAVFKWPGENRRFEFCFR